MKSYKEVITEAKAILEASSKETNFGSLSSDQRFVALGLLKKKKFITGSLSDRDENKYVFTVVGDKVTDVALKEASGDKEAYQKFFDAKLAKYKVKSPAELDDEQKKKFFDEVEKEWTGDED